MKIIDVFCFLQEIDLLEIRLNELKNVVDTFVIIEANVTGSGLKKNYNFEKYKENFKEFNIIYNKVDLTNSIDLIKNDQHVLMYLQRNEMLFCLKELFLNDKDIIIFSDLDEIPKSETIKNIREFGLAHNPSVLSIRGYYWFCNTPISQPRNHAWFKCPIVISYDKFKDSDLRKLRDGKDHLFEIKNSGWHFSHVGTIEEKRQKMLASSHTEYSSDYYNSVDNINRRSKNLIDPYERGGYSISNVNDVELPNYLQINKDKFEHLLWNPTKN